VERNRPRLAVAVLALGGLAKETNVLAVGALARPAERGSRAWLGLAGRALLVAAPLALWLLYIQWHVGPAGDVGVRNFDWPLVGYAAKWASVAADLNRPETAPYAQWSLLMLVTLAVQFLFFALRPQPGAAWWRVGAAFAGLMLVLGGAVWEGYPGAAGRVLVAMQLAFNVLVPRGRAWAVVLVLGNLTLLNAPNALRPPTGDGYRVNGPAGLLVAADGAQAGVEFDAAWFPVEGHHENTWHWSHGDGAVILVNPQKFPVTARVTLVVHAITPRNLQIRRDGRELWRGAVAGAVLPVELGPLTLAPGRNAFEFKSDQPPVRPPHGDSRLLAVCVGKLAVDLRR